MAYHPFSCVAFPGHRRITTSFESSSLVNLSLIISRKDHLFVLPITSVTFITTSHLAKNHYYKRHNRHNTSSCKKPLLQVSQPPQSSRHFILQNQYRSRHNRHIHHNILSYKNQ